MRNIHILEGLNLSCGGAKPWI